MRISMCLSQLLQAPNGRRGLIQEIVDATDIERHTVAAILRNEVKYISLDALGKLCDYLIDKAGIPAASLPGALFAAEPLGFIEMLAKSRELAFCLGKRHNEAWTGRDFVIATDSQLQSELLARILRCQPPADDALDDTARRSSVDFHRVDQYLVTAPSEHDTESQWNVVRAGAEERYRWFEETPTDKALLALGSNKVNPLVELILANAFSATPFMSQDRVARPADRRCPLMFRYRQRDPKPVSCCGGMTLARKAKEDLPGIYYELSDRRWACCPCEDPSDTHPSRDAGFICYVHRPHLRQVELACGGFSGRSTGALAMALHKMIHHLRPPQFVGSREIGLFIVKFTFPPGTADAALKPTDYELVRVDEDVIKRRCEEVK